MLHQGITDGGAERSADFIEKVQGRTLRSRRREKLFHSQDTVFMILEMIHIPQDSGCFLPDFFQFLCDFSVFPLIGKGKDILKDIGKRSGLRFFFLCLFPGNKEIPDLRHGSRRFHSHTCQGKEELGLGIFQIVRCLSQMVQ